MTNEQIVTVARLYERRLLDGEYDPVRADSALLSYSPPSEQLSHALGMLQEIVNGNVADSKAERWLCFAQGVLWCHGMYSIDEMREHNR